MQTAKPRLKTVRVPVQTNSVALFFLTAIGYSCRVYINTKIINVNKKGNVITWKVPALLKTAWVHGQDKDTEKHSSCIDLVNHACLLHQNLGQLVVFICILLHFFQEVFLEYLNR